MTPMQKLKAQADRIQVITELGKRIDALPIKQKDFAKKYGFHESEVSLAKTMARMPREKKLQKLIDAVEAEEALHEPQPTTAKAHVCPACGQDLPVVETP